MSSPDTADCDRGERTAHRKGHSSEWLYLTQHDAVPILVDALLDLPPDREFNETEFAEHAGGTRQTVGNYTDLPWTRSSSRKFRTRAHDATASQTATSSESSTS